MFNFHFPVKKRWFQKFFTKVISKVKRMIILIRVRIPPAAYILFLYIDDHIYTYSVYKEQYFQGVEILKKLRNSTPWFKSKKEQFKKWKILRIFGGYIPTGDWTLVSGFEVWRATDYSTVTKKFWQKKLLIINLIQQKI